MKRELALAWPLAALIFLALDAAWLSGMTPLVYRREIGHLLSDRFDLLAAMLFYVLYLSGMVAFAIAPALVDRRPWRAAWRGGLLGLVCYGTYDLTNQGTLRGWPWLVTLVDLAWGTLATAITSILASAGTLAILRLAARRRWRWAPTSQ